MKKLIYSIAIILVVGTTTAFLLLRSEEVEISSDSQVLYSLGGIPDMTFLLDGNIKKQIIAELNKEPEKIYSFGKPSCVVSSGYLEIEQYRFILSGNDVYLYNNWVSNKWNVKGLHQRLSTILNKKILTSD